MYEEFLRACPTRADHDWGGWVHKEVGRHPSLGPFQRLERRCLRPGCGRVERVTEFSPKTMPDFDAGYKVEERPK